MNDFSVQMSILQSLQNGKKHLIIIIIITNIIANILIIIILILFILIICSDVNCNHCKLEKLEQPRGEVFHYNGLGKHSNKNLAFFRNIS